MKRTSISLGLGLIALVLAGCGGTTADVGERILVIGATGTSFTRLSALNYAQVGSTVTISGLTGGESIQTVDVRPATGQLYGYTDLDNLYVINQITGVATFIGNAPTTGAVMDMEFNPVVDRIRISTTDGSNVRVNPDTGAIVATDTSFAYAPTDVNFGDSVNIAGMAYDRSVIGATQTTLYAVDGVQDTLCTVGGINGTPSPNSGQLNTLGATTQNLAGDVGFDISGTTNIGYLMSGGALYTVNLNNGTMTSVVGSVTANDICVLP